MDAKTARGLGMFGLIVTGFGGLFTGFLAFVNGYNWTGVGACLAASAIAFGFLSRSGTQP